MIIDVIKPCGIIGETIEVSKMYMDPLCGVVIVWSGVIMEL